MDIEGSTTRTNTVKARLRQGMYELLEQALQVGGITERHRDELVDRGDGALVLIHPVDEVPKTTLFDTFVPALSQLLAEYNRTHPDDGLRLRTAVHEGAVHRDPKGLFGADIDIACRLLDAQEVKAKLAQTTGSLVLVVSDHIYRTVIKQGYEGIDTSAFEPLVRLEVGGDPQCGWVSVPTAPTGLIVVDGYQRREVGWRQRWTQRLPFVEEQQA